MKCKILAGLIVVGFGAKAMAQDVNETIIDQAGSAKVTAEIWVDNWFALHVNGAPLLEDSVAYKTERSFNAERVTFSTDLPMTVAFEFRDFMADDTGLEYIGTDRQQMGDGGAIAQFRDALTGDHIGVSDADWRCVVVHHAPVSKDCENANDPVVGEGICAADFSDIPADWTSPGFDDSGWDTAFIHSVSDVGPKMGYDAIDWDANASLIWGPDLEQDNIVLCRATLGS